MALLEQHIPEYKGRRVVLTLPTNVKTISRFSQETVQFPQGAKGILTGDVMINSGTNFGQEVVVANAVAEFYSEDGRKHTVLLPFQFFTLE